MSEFLKSILNGWSSANFRIVFSQSFAPFINFCKYSRLYFDLQFSACMFASSPENSDIAEFRDFASIMNLPSFIMNVQASATIAQSSIEVIKSTELSETFATNSKFGKSFSSLSTSIRFNLKFLLILSCMSMLTRFSFFSIIKLLPELHLLRICFKLSRFIPKTSFSTSNWEKEDFGILKLTIEIFAGSIAIILIPNSLNFILTSVTKSEIISTPFANAMGFSNLTSMIIG